MGQKSLNTSVSKCVQAQQFHSDLCKVTYQSNQPSCKWDEEAVSVPQRRRWTTEQLSSWIARLSKTKIAARKHNDLRRQAILHNAYSYVKAEIACLQRERQQRWKELKPLFFLETASTSPPQQFSPVDMAACDDKMADEHQMADAEIDQSEQERPSTPLPSVGAAFKRYRCGCFSSESESCQCGENFHLSKRFRPSSPDEDLKSLDLFLSSLQCNSRQVG